MDDKLLNEYLLRIGVERPGSADAPALRSLHRAHQMTVPFENLSIHLPEPISLGADDLIDKIVVRRRGGFCYELNGAFALLLQALGFQVRRATFPLLFESRQDQDDPAGLFLLADAEDGDVDVLKDGEPQYRLERRERLLADFVPTCWWQQTSPLSHFTQGLICSLLTHDGRVSLSGRTLIRTTGRARTEDQMPTDEAVLAAYRQYFGITLDRVPQVRPPAQFAQFAQSAPGADGLSAATTPASSA